MDRGQIKITVLLFGACREAAGVEELELGIESQATAETAWESLRARFPQLDRFDRSILLAVNEEHARRETTLDDGDTLAVFPPVSGGQPDYRFSYDQ